MLHEALHFNIDFKLIFYINFICFYVILQTSITVATRIYNNDYDIGKIPNHRIFLEEININSIVGLFALQV